MKKYIFIVPPLTGHVNPTLGIGQELIKRGHKVSWISLDKTLDQKLPKNGNLLVCPIDVDNTEKEKLINHAKELQNQKVYGIDSLKFLYDEVLIPLNKYMLYGINQLLDKYIPDFVITDHQIFAGAVACTKKQIPFATSVTAPASIKVNPFFPKIHEWEGEQIIAFQKHFGVDSDQRLDCSPLLTLVYTSKYFIENPYFPENYQFVGPIISKRSEKLEFDWDKFYSWKNKPKILVSIGTTFNPSEQMVFFNKVIEAFQNENIGVVLVSDPILFNTIPDNFIIQKKIPQLEIIPKIDLVICHGGHNTVCESLFAGIPLIVIPIAYDQSFVSDCVVKNKAGIRLNFNRFKPIQLKEATKEVLINSSYAENALKIQDSFIKAGGINTTVNLLEKF